MKAVKVIITTLIVIFIAVQFIPSGIPPNVPDDNRSIANDSLVAGSVLKQLRNSCFDCHSNQVNFPWYSKMAPASWFLAGHINKGRSHLNFSEWEDYSNREKVRILEEIKDEVVSGGMPLKSYLLIHRDAKPDSAEVTAIMKWADDATARMLD